MLEKPDVAIGAISIASRGEQELLLQKAYNRKFDLSDAKPVYQIVEEVSKGYGEKNAVIYHDTRLTYQELNRKSNAYAQYLRSLGIQKNETIGVLVKRSHKMIAVLLGILKCGCAYLPLDKSNPRERLNYMLDDSKVRFLFVSDGYDKLADYEGNYLYVDKIWEQEKDIKNSDCDSNMNDLMYMIYTSGSTGKPKAVCLEHKSVFNFMKSMKMELPYEDVTMLCVTTMAFDIFGLEVYLPLMNGQKIVIADEEEQLNPDLLADVILENSVNVIQMTPSRMKIFLSSDKASHALQQVRVIILGGEPLTEEIVQAIRKLTQARIFNVYGPTETTIWSSISEVTHAESITIGKPIGNNSFYVLDDDNQLVPNGIPGELVISGDSLARGYYNREDITKEKFIPNIFENTGRMYKTGDIVIRLQDGNISYVERKDFQLKMHGFRIELGEIENCLKNELLWKDVIVIPVEAEGEKVLAAYYVNDTQAEYDLVVSKVSKKLPYYMVPSFFIKIDKIPTNVSGKVDRAALKKIPIGERECKKHELPANELEQKIYDVWKEHLNLSEFDVNDNFFQIGGHSLKAVKVCAALKNRGLDVGINDLYRLVSVREVAHFIENQANDSNKINTVEEMQEFLRERYGDVILNNISFDMESYRILELDVPKESLEKLKEEIDIRVSEKIKPDYVIVNNNGLGYNSSIELLKNNPADMIEKSLSGIKTSYDTLSEEVRKGRVSIRFPLSGAQKLRLLDPQNIIAYFETDKSHEKVEKAMLEVINEQGLMRSFLVKQETEYYWEQHEKVKKIHIPMVDLSEFTPSASDKAVKEIAKSIFRQKYEGNSHVLFQMISTKINENKKRVLFVANHIMFDGFSAEILMRSVKQKLAGTEKIRNLSQYSDYVKLLEEGPKNISSEEMKVFFEFERYEKAVFMLKEKLSEFNRSKQTVLHYNIPLIPNESDTMNMFEVSYEIFKLYCETFFALSEYPLIAIHYGRKYGDSNFFDTLGEFIDYVPLVAERSLSASEFTQKMTSQNTLLEKHQVNFAKLVTDEEFSGSYNEIRKFMKDIQKNPYFVFNYQGVENGKKEELAEIIDQETEYRLNQLIRFSSKVVDDNLNIYIYMPFELSKGDIDTFRKQTLHMIQNNRNGE